MKERPGQPGTWAASSPLSLSETQDLAEQIGDIVHQAAGTELAFSLTITLSGAAGLDRTVVERINEILRGVNAGFQLRQPGYDPHGG